MPHLVLDRLSLRTPCDGEGSQAKEVSLGCLLFVRPDTSSLNISGTGPSARRRCRTGSRKGRTHDWPVVSELGPA